MKILIEEAELTSKDIQQDFWDWVFTNDYVQAAWEWYNGYSKDALKELVYDYLDDIWKPAEVYVAMDKGGWLVYAQDTNEQISPVFNNPGDAQDYIEDNITNYNADVFNAYYKAAQTAINEFGFYNWSEEE